MRAVMSSLDRFCKEYISEWSGHPEHLDRLLKDARSAMQGSNEDWVWCRESLEHSKKRWFVARLFAKSPVPGRLLSSMIEAAIDVDNPSTNRHFIEPCVRSLGALYVLKALHKVLEGQSAIKQTGALDALYWVNTNPRQEDLSEERGLLRKITIKLFLETDYVPLQRSIISKLYPHSEDEDPRFSLVVEMARNHEDEYIRHRIEVQLGLSDGPLQILPLRNT